MGIGFVMLFHLIIILILSSIIAIIGGLITAFCSKERKKRKILLAFLAPFAGFYTLYFCAIIGSSIVSEKKNIDIGFGDCWYVPLENDCQLLFIYQNNHLLKKMERLLFLLFQRYEKMEIMF
ncbi:hypothetical protein [Chryseobacterium gambrini]|uniref:Uncharacterized protein n=1 Tax=Chryseobacterium gambrini TaxID=373672 RepID=A0A1N7QGK9_9FLAO|nr:hypothetical protein [Chryseobacterium gambrini]SIT21929.1 hypothetical protein SAMN05421785_111111 [Chryseobacterium gambrini]